MKRSIPYAYSFAPGSGQVNLSGIAGFALGNLYAIVNVTSGGIIYAAGQPGLGCSAVSGTTLTLQASTTGMSSSDALMILYEDSGPQSVSVAPTALTPVAGGASSIATGGTAVTVFAANAIANGARIINPTTAIESLFVDETGAAPNLTGTGTTVELVPGQAWSTAAPLTTAVKAVAATTGHAFHASKR